MIAVKKSGQIALATDSQWTDSGNKYQRVSPKIITGIAGGSNLMMTTGPSAGYEMVLWEDLQDFINSDERWYDHWALHCLTGKDETPMRRMTDKEFDIPVLVVWRDGIFKVWPSGGIFENKSNIAVCGSGGDIALGAAYVLNKKHNDPAKIAVRAVHAACMIDANCSSPIICETIDIRKGRN